MNAYIENRRNLAAGCYRDIHVPLLVKMTSIIVYVTSQIIYITLRNIPFQFFIHIYNSCLQAQPDFTCTKIIY